MRPTRLTAISTVLAAAGVAFVLAAALMPWVVPLPWLAAAAFASAFGAHVLAGLIASRRSRAHRAAPTAEVEARMLSVRLALLQQRNAELQAQNDALSSEAARLRESSGSPSADTDELVEAEESVALPLPPLRIQPGTQLRKLG